MSASHHSGPEHEQAQQRLVDQIMGKAQQHYSEGRLNSTDQGDLALAVATDKPNSVVLVHFGKPVVWFGMPKKETLAFANLLIERANEL